MTLQTSFSTALEKLLERFIDKKVSLLMKSDC